MLKKLEVLEDKYKELTEKISDPEIINDQKTWQKYMKEHADFFLGLRCGDTPKQTHDYIMTVCYLS